MTPILSVNNLTVTVDNKDLIKDISFELLPGDNLSIIGPNGAGKTILLKALLDAIPYSGRISWDPGARLGYVPQKIDADRHLPLTFKNLFEAKCRILGSASDAETIKRVGLSGEILTTPVGHLSGGQFQRGLIAFALLGNPSVLLFDEPTASIDKPGEEQIYELTHRLQEQYGLTTIMVSHDLNFVHRYSNKVLCLNRQKVCFGEPKEALTAEVMERLYGATAKHYEHTH